jgi:hypothetical protein
MKFFIYSKQYACFVHDHCHTHSQSIMPCESTKPTTVFGSIKVANLEVTGCLTVPVVPVLPATETITFTGVTTFGTRYNTSLHREMLLSKGPLEIIQTTIVVGKNTATVGEYVRSMYSEVYPEETGESSHQDKVEKLISLFDTFEKPNVNIATTYISWDPVIYPDNAEGERDDVLVLTLDPGTIMGQVKELMWLRSATAPQGKIRILTKDKYRDIWDEARDPTQITLLIQSQKHVVVWDGNEWLLNAAERRSLAPGTHANPQIISVDTQHTDIEWGSNIANVPGVFTFPIRINPSGFQVSPITQTFQYERAPATGTPRVIIKGVSGGDISLYSQGDTLTVRFTNNKYIDNGWAVVSKYVREFDAVENLTVSLKSSKLNTDIVIGDQTHINDIMKDIKNTTRYVTIDRSAIPDTQLEIRINLNLLPGLYNGQLVTIFPSVRVRFFIEIYPPSATNHAHFLEVENEGLNESITLVWHNHEWQIYANTTANSSLNKPANWL